MKRPGPQIAVAVVLFLLGTSPAVAKTADQQSNAREDLQTTAKIRRALVDDESLSFAAKNLTIVTQAGKVHLSGLVNSATEKARVEAEATKVAGTNVTSDIQIKTDK